jgi:hypothetical protein
MDSIYSLVKKIEDAYVNGTVDLGRYVGEFSQYDTIEKINAYSNSKHTTGETDSLGREKPFFNITTAVVNVWNRATDIDRKNIRFRATAAKNFIKSFIASILLRNWMRKEKFGQFLNDWGRTLAKYGSAVCKFVEKDGSLYPSVVSWSKLICDPVEFDGNLKIEKLYYTPSQLRQIPAYDQDKVEEAINSLAARTTLEGESKDENIDYIGVYEAHGELPLSFLTGKETDEKTYCQQMHVIFINEGTAKEDYKDRVEVDLYSGKEKIDPYIITHLIKEDGRTLSIGAVESLFEAQWMCNHSVKQIKDQLDLASKMVLQTSDETFVGRNILTNIETGQILVTADQKPLTQVNNQSHDVPVITSYLQQWQALGRDITGTPEALTGDTMPSGTAYRQVAALQQEAHSLFELMTENKGLYLEDMIKTYVLPFFKKKLTTAEEVALVLEPEELETLDSLALPGNLEEEIKRLVLTDNEPLPTVEELTATVKERTAKLGATRFIKPSEGEMTWKEYFKDLPDDIEVVITGENLNKEALMTTLTTVLQTVAQNPNILTDPTMKKIFGKILEATGEVSSVELQSLPTPPIQGQPTQPTNQTPASNTVGSMAGRINNQL